MGSFPSADAEDAELPENERARVYELVYELVAGVKDRNSMIMQQMKAHEGAKRGSQVQEGSQEQEGRHGSHVNGPLGPSWSHFGVISGHLGNILGPSWGILGHLGLSWAILRLSLAHLGHLEPS